MSHSGFDFEALIAREEYPVMHALMQRVDTEIAGLQAMVNAYSGVNGDTTPHQPVEDLLAAYEAATAVARLDDHIQMLPIDLRAEALAIVPGAELVQAAADEFDSSTSMPSSARLRQRYLEQRLPNVRSVGYTGILNIGGCLSNIYLDVLDSADAARIDPRELILDDDLFAAVVRAPITPTQFIAQEVVAIERLTPGMFLEADLDSLRSSYLANSAVLDPEDEAEIEHIVESRRQNPAVQSSSVLISSAFRHGHARATLSRVAELWSEHALPHVDRKVMARLNNIIDTTLPFPDGVIGEIDDATLAAIKDIRPEDFI